MILPLAPLILSIVAWLGSKAVPAVWWHHIEKPTRTQIKFAEDLCKNHNDCTVEKQWAMPKENHAVIRKATKDSPNN